MKEIIIKILDIDYKIKQTFRGLMLFEELTGKNSFEVSESINDIIKLLYCFLRASNQNIFNYSLDEFLNILDDHQEIFEEFAEYLQSLSPEATQPKKKKVNR